MRTLLLADDNITVQRVIALTFAGESIQVVSVADGQQAIERMAAHQPDIVLAGTTLPGVNGYDLARFMRGKTELRMVPVLLLAGAFENVDEASLAASGANGILEKPVEPTTLINRVKELLGLKSEEKPVSTGRLVTPGAAPADRNRPSATPRSITSARPQPSIPPPGMPAKQDQPRDKSSVESGPRAPADSSSRPADYLDTLDAAFDSLDQQLSGRVPPVKAPTNPAGLHAQGAGAGHAPGQAPSTSSGASVNPVFEVDDDGFSAAETQARADARAGDREIAEDLRDPRFQAPVDPAATPVFEVDDEWFAEDNKARAQKALEQEQLATEMGVHEVEFPVAAKPLEPPTAAEPTAPPPEIRLVAPEITDEVLDQVASRVADLLTVGAFGEALKEAMAATIRETVLNVVTETSERLIRDSASSVVSQISERIVRETVHVVVREASERIVRDSVHAIVSETSERVLGDTVPAVVAEVSERLIRDAAPGVVAETSERVVRDTVHRVATEATERTVRDTVQRVAAEATERTVRDTVHTIAAEATERAVRDAIHTVVAEASERAVRDAVPAVVAETSDRLIRDAMPAVIAERSERLARDTVFGVMVEASERVIRDAAPTVLTETSERLIREAVPAAVADASERVVRESVRGVVSETSERLVREEIERIKSKART